MQEEPVKNGETKWEEKLNNAKDSREVSQEKDIEYPWFSPSRTSFHSLLGSSFRLPAEVLTVIQPVYSPPLHNNIQSQGFRNDSYVIRSKSTHLSLTFFSNSNANFQLFPQCPSYMSMHISLNHLLSKLIPFPLFPNLLMMLQSFQLDSFLSVLHPYQFIHLLIKYY